MLHFDIDSEQLDKISDELGASDKQVALAFNRAIKRTVMTLSKMARKGLKDELQLRNLKAIRRRLKTLQAKRSFKKGTGLDEVRLWFGANNLPISAFKGSPKKTARGAEFRGKKFDGAFIGKGKSGKRTIFKRKGKAKLPIIEQTMPVKDEIDVFVEDEIFVNLEQIFFKHFKSDLRARTIYGVGGKYS